MRTTSYAVVDLETTGTQRNSGHRIIQFGCAVIVDGKITDKISLTINPLRDIPADIIQLTQLDSAVIKSAPIFSEVAATLHQLLRNKTFVAHNVNFDFPFLNEEFVRCGLPPLNVPAIDTVELAQIMLPQAPSYRLQDLSGYLNIVHEHPHQADSDAIATARILLLLLKRIEQLPSQTRRQLAQLGKTLSRQTGHVFRDKHIGAPVELPVHLIQVQTLVLRRPIPKTPQSRVSARGEFPLTRTDKLRQWGDQLKQRPAQDTMMAFINQQLETSINQPIVVEAPTGIGKSLGYLLPLSYYLANHPGKRLVISTPTTILQHQLDRQAVPLLNSLRKTNFQSVLLKSARHYIDLDRFAAYLRHGQQNRNVLINEMRILVWLTQTTTGDLDELQMTNYETMFFNSINHLPQINENSAYYIADFWARLIASTKTADIVITNNAYLAQHLDDFSENQSVLVIDEAQHFADDLTRSSHHSFSVMRLGEWAKQLSDLIHSLVDNNEADPTLDQVHRQIIMTQVQLSSYQTTLQNLNDQLVLLTGNKIVDQPVYLDLSKNGIQRTKLLKALTSTIEQLDRYLDACLPLEGVLTASQTDYVTEQHVHDWQRQNNRLEEQLDYLIDAKDHLSDPVFREFGFYLDIDDDGINYRFNWLAKSHQQLRHSIDQQFPQQLYIGASLAVGSNFSYFLRQLNFETDHVALLQLHSPFDYAQKAELLIPETTYSPSENGADYDRWLASIILPVIEKNPVQTLILFNSLASVRNVYYRLQSALGREREILAQGITGSNDKIAKRFRLTKDGILLGAQSFWEGVDFPNDQLSLLIITRIPFESPKNPTTNYRQQLLADKNLAPFQADVLPRAILKLKQGFGRLIRTESDRGIVLVLDERIIKSNYQTEIQAAFPDGLPQLILENNQLAEHIHDFLNTNNN